MYDKRKHALPVPSKKTEDVADVIRGDINGAFETQAISDVSAREAHTRVAIPSDICVQDSKDWVDFNQK